MIHTVVRRILNGTTCPEFQKNYFDVHFYYMHEECKIPSTAAFWIALAPSKPTLSIVKQALLAPFSVFLAIHHSLQFFSKIFSIVELTRAYAAILNQSCWNQKPIWLHFIFLPKRSWDRVLKIPTWLITT